MPTRPSRLLQCAVLAVLASCATHGAGTAPASPTKTGSSARPATSTTSTTTTTKPPDPELLAAGDIAVCGVEGSRLTAAIVSAHPDAVVAAVGDLAYGSGTSAEFKACYDPAWGGFKARTHPALGNHEYATAQAAGYFDYWGPAAGPAGEGWYSYDVGAWHVAVLNSNCGPVACGPTSVEVRWLAADLAAHPTRCALAYWHHPRWSSGLHGSQAQVDPLWKAAAAGGVDVVLSGHDHDYERFAPIDGVRQFVVGTGGAPRYPIGPGIAGSEVRDNTAWGVLSLTLHADSYDWRFLPAAGSTFTDSGTGACR